MAAYPAPAGGEVLADYAAELAALTFNSKPIINSLTIIAGETQHAAPQIVALVEARIAHAPPDQALPALYLLDSIVKNIGGPYLSAFAAHIVETFVRAYARTEPPTRAALVRLLATWQGIFPDAALQHCAAFVAQLQAQEQQHQQQRELAPQAVLPSGQAARSARGRRGAPGPTSASARRVVPPPPPPAQAPPPLALALPPAPAPAPAAVATSAVLDSGLLAQLAALLSAAGPEAPSAALLASLSLPQQQQLLALLPAAAPSLAPPPAPLGGLPTPDAAQQALAGLVQQLQQTQAAAAAAQQQQSQAQLALKALAALQGAITAPAPAPLAPPPVPAAAPPPVRDRVPPLVSGHRPQEAAVRSLYSDYALQCTQCGLRFADRRRMEAHLDWHFKSNRRIKARKVFSRPWFLAPDVRSADLRCCRADSAVQEWARSSIEGGEALRPTSVNIFGEAAAAPSPFPNESVSLPSAEPPPVAASGEGVGNGGLGEIEASGGVVAKCSACGETFEKYYSPDADRWLLRNSMQHPRNASLLLHRDCLPTSSSSAAQKHDLPAGSDDASAKRPRMLELK